MTNEHGYCPSCNASLDGGSIWNHFYTQFTEGEGYWLDEDGKYIVNKRLLTNEQALSAADEVAASYGATRDKGQWGRQIGLYDLFEDRTVEWRCPDCGHEWKRE